MAEQEALTALLATPEDAEGPPRDTNEVPEAAKGSQPAKETHEDASYNGQKNPLPRRPQPKARGRLLPHPVRESHDSPALTRRRQGRYTLVHRPPRTQQQPLPRNHLQSARKLHQETIPRLPMDFRPWGT
ncbi:uncharacterized protein Z519_04075 [Cladophialophora bantiana CBS 173.52]|uniref:Uncharacterized protein n=1 Tax=Cladophialophora bantiana (strain ATCC 10958 / CBS 173.52 / CDC B-1940 / NIH 8579) TaxID=1442370 RepID=A0A0D2HX55_CLAB1|nr:uncharacterized protein Z519_04075 [Cladophialophora bantiana CBS 173.52]KIW95490.1 hypothetical protein Z519_04075 [Cladophialophora bantiana CBS 173.52]